MVILNEEEAENSSEYEIFFAKFIIYEILDSNGNIHNDEKSFDGGDFIYKCWCL